ncbi:TPA: hypothetical protein PPO51_002496 [Clostridioides difficile]|nr:hypothetical protein [Clostridioides difficile]HDJ1470969.1 hypothetical protein [Clostridioides difficile]
MNKEMRYEFETSRGICELVISKNLKEKKFEIETLAIDGNLLKDRGERWAELTYYCMEFVIELGHEVAKRAGKLFNMKKKKFYIKAPAELEKMRDEFLKKAYQIEIDYYNNVWENLGENETIELVIGTSRFYINDKEINQSTNLKEIMDEIDKVAYEVGGIFKKRKTFEFADTCQVTKKTLLEAAEKAKQILAEKQEKTEKQKEDRKQKEQEKIARLIEEAKRTGQKQVVKSWTVSCNDPNEACDLDIMTEMIDKNGKIEIIRSHTY